MTNAKLLLAAAPCLLMGGCAGMGSLPVDKPCGIITDSLSDVRGRTAKGDQRISEHFERGVRAGCWTRAGADKPDTGISAAVPRAPVYQRQTRVQRILHRAPAEVEQPAGVEEVPAAEQPAEPPVAAAPVPPPRPSRWQRFKARIRHPFKHEAI